MYRSEISQLIIYYKEHMLLKDLAHTLRCDMKTPSVGRTLLVKGKTLCVSELVHSRATVVMLSLFTAMTFICNYRKKEASLHV